MAARVQWGRSRSGQTSHAVIDGDGLTLCGQLAERHAAVVAVSTAEGRLILSGTICPDCRAIITEAASVLDGGNPSEVAKPQVSANARSVANDPVAAASPEHYRLIGIGAVCACRGPWPCPEAEADHV